MTGIGRYLANFLDYAAAHPGGHEFYLYGDQDTTDPPQRPSGEFRRLRRWATLWWDQRTVARAARRDGVDLFFSPYVKAPAFPGCPFVTTAHDLLFFKTREYSGLRDRAYQRLFLAQGRFLAKRAARIVTVSEYSKRDIVDLFGVGAERIRVVPNAVSQKCKPVESEAEIDAVRRRYGIQGSFVLYVGNFKPHKNVAVLLEAYACLDPSLREQAGLVLGGKPDAFSEGLKQRIDELGIGPRVRFTGFVEEDDLPALYSAASVFVFPSLYEGFGLPPLEAMACGTPVACSSATSLPEVVGDAAILFDPHDAKALAEDIEGLLTSPERANRMTRRGLDRAQLFAPERIGARLLGVLESAADEQISDDHE